MTLDLVTFPDGLIGLTPDITMLVRCMFYMDDFHIDWRMYEMGVMILIVSLCQSVIQGQEEGFVRECSCFKKESKSNPLVHHNIPQKHGCRLSRLSGTMHKHNELEGNGT